MQLQFNKVIITDPGSAYHHQLVNLSIEEGKITKIKAVKNQGDKNKSTITQGTNTIFTFSGFLNVSPGWVDVLADYCEPGYEHKETIAGGLKTAAAGGFTNVLLAPNTKPVTANKAALQYIKQQASGNIVNLYPIGAATRDAEGKELAEMMDMQQHGAIAFGDGWKPVQDAALMLKALEYVKAFHGIIIQLPVETRLSAGGLMNEGELSTRLGMPGIPTLAETLLVYRDIELARYTRSRLHISGISCKASVELIRQARQEGLDITCSVTPYHIAFNDQLLATYNSTYKVAPPLRSEEDRKAIVAAVADGTIDCIATHHRPQDWDAKTKEFEYAAEGMAIQGNAFSMVYEAMGAEGKNDLINTFSANARKIFGLADATIAEGNSPDMTLYTTGPEAVYSAYRMTKAVNDPWMNRGSVAAVRGIVNNNQIKLNQ
jgi:dihydroorotase